MSRWGSWFAGPTLWPGTLGPGGVTAGGCARSPPPESTWTLRISRAAASRFRGPRSAACAGADADADRPQNLRARALQLQPHVGAARLQRFVQGDAGSHSRQPLRDGSIDLASALPATVWRSEARGCGPASTWSVRGREFVRWAVERRHCVPSWSGRTCPQENLGLGDSLAFSVRLLTAYARTSVLNPSRNRKHPVFHLSIAYTIPCPYPLPRQRPLGLLAPKPFSPNDPASPLTASSVSPASRSRNFARCGFLPDELPQRRPGWLQQSIPGSLPVAASSLSLPPSHPFRPPQRYALRV